MKRLSLILIFSLCFPLPSFAESLVLKSGKTVQGKLLEKTDAYIKIELQDVALTYFTDEVESIDGRPVSSPEASGAPPADTHQENKSAPLEQILAQAKKLEQLQTKHDYGSFFSDAFQCGARGDLTGAEENLRKISYENQDDEIASYFIKIIADVNGGRARREFATSLFKGFYEMTVTSDDERAIAELKDAAKPDSAEFQEHGFLVLAALGMAYLGSGDSKNAVENLEKAVQLKPDVGTFRLALGEAYYSANDLKKAEENVRAALEIFLKFKGYTTEQAKAADYLTKLRAPR